MNRPSIGAHTYGTPQLRVWQPDTNCIIGRYCSISDDVEILLGGEHRTDRVTTYPLVERGIANTPDAALNGYTKGDVVIGNDVWLGRGCKILSGVTIGNGAIIAANSVVARNVAPYAVVAGNPSSQKSKAAAKLPWLPAAPGSI